MMYYTKFSTTVCEIILAGDKDGLAHLFLNTGEGKKKIIISNEWQYNPDFFYEIKKQLEEYFHNKRKTFNIKINPKGTDFQKKVWNALREIPYGEVSSYKDIAIKIGNEKACRAVGMANSKNPIPIITPCHRVIGSNGQMTGFASGLKTKEKLLKIEGFSRIQY